MKTATVYFSCGSRCCLSFTDSIRYTTLRGAKRAFKNANAGQLAKDIQEITPAIQAAARLVKRYDHLTPTANDIEQVTRNYAAYIVDCAKYEIENA